MSNMNSVFSWSSNFVVVGGWLVSGQFCQKVGGRFASGFKETGKRDLWLLLNCWNELEK